MSFRASFLLVNLRVKYEEKRTFSDAIEAEDKYCKRNELIT